MGRTLRTLQMILMLAAVTMTCGYAQTSSSKAATQPKPQLGPATIKLNDQTTLTLPKGYLYFDKAGTATLMKEMGNPPSPNDIGLIAKSDNNDWFIVVDFTTPGHISDSDAKEMDADAILTSIKEGTAEANEERKKMGSPVLEIKGWAEKPRYDAAQHRLVWAINGSSTQGDVVNYCTRILGRENLLSLNLICEPSKLSAVQGDLKVVLDNVWFNSGQAYADFQQGRDKDSGMSLTGLILGGGAAAAAAKMGIFAKLGNFLFAAILALKKVLILIFAALYGGIKKLFGRKDDAPPPPPADSTL